MSKSETELNIHNGFHVLFCESIREETNGKYSYIGVYPNTIEVESFPYVLSQLSIVGAFIIPKLQIQNNKPEIIILVGEEQIGQIEIKNDEFKNENDDSTISINFHIQGGSLTIDSACSIKAMLKIDDALFVSPKKLNIVCIN